MSTYPWQVEALRFSFINLQSDQASDGFGWVDLLGSPPESVTEKKSMGIKTEQGNWLRGTLSVNRQVGRIDVVYSFAQPEAFTDLDSPLPNAGSIDEVFSACAELFNDAKKLRFGRFAFGAVLLMPVDEASKGYEHLKTFLPFIDFKSDMRDFFMQINRPKQSPLGVEVNELSKWGCVNVKAVNLVELNSMVSAEVHAVRLELDINTPEQTAPLNTDVSALVHEFVERGRALSERGAV
jgi:hypothetical protein